MSLPPPRGLRTKQAPPGAVTKRKSHVVSAAAAKLRQRAAELRTRADEMDATADRVESWLA